MLDKAQDILEKAFGKEEPLTEIQKQTRRNAAAFALATFSDNFREKSKLNSLNVKLTDEQIDFAKNFSDVFPKPEDALPESEFNSARAGYNSLVSTPMYEVIPASFDKSITTFGEQHAISKQLLQKDPSGILYIQSLLAKIEDRERHGKFANLEEKEAEFRAKILEMFETANIFTDEIPQRKPMDDRSMEEDIIKIFLEAFSGGAKSPRDNFLTKERQNIHQEIPLEFCKPDRKVMSTDSLKAIGARLAFEHYSTAVNIYLKRWGK